MSGLSTLIRLHRHELDEKRRALGDLYSQMALLEKERQALEHRLAAETAAVAEMAEVPFTYAGFAEKNRQERQRIEDSERELEQAIQELRDSMMESFAELKKYEMTEAERNRLEEEERAFREAAILDEVGLEGYRRRQEEEGA